MLNELRMITNPVSECERLPRWYLQCHTNMRAPIWIIMREPKRCKKLSRRITSLPSRASKTSRSQKAFSSLEHPHSCWVSSLPQTVAPSTKTAEFLELYHYTYDSQRCPQPPSAEQVRAQVCQKAALSHFKIRAAAFYIHTSWKSPSESHIWVFGYMVV